MHHWHPGQRWIWEPGGFGVFDPGINALSMLTAILPPKCCVESALLEFPENQQSPIAANLRMRTEDGVEINAEFDFRQKGEQSWDIELRPPPAISSSPGGGGWPSTATGHHRREPGGRISAALQRFAELCDAGKSDVDWRPFQLVADAFLIGERRIVAPTRSEAVHMAMERALASQ